MNSIHIPGDGKTYDMPESGRCIAGTCLICHADLVITSSTVNSAGGYCPNCGMVFITKAYTPNPEDAGKSYDQLMRECCERRGVPYDPDWQTDTMPYFNDTQYEYKLPEKR